MADARFFLNTGPYNLAEIAGRVNGVLDANSDPALKIKDVASLDAATPDDISFFSGSRHKKELAASRAGVCIIKEEEASLTPSGMRRVFCDDPSRAFALAADLFYPETDCYPNQKHSTTARGRHIDPAASLEAGVTVEPGAFIAANAVIGQGALIMGNSYIGQNVTIGRECIIYPNVTITHALVGDRVVLKSGASVGQPGFGFAMGLDGHTRVPQLGRVIIQDDVLIGANTTIDRGALSDTVIGEGTKIDNLVHIAHNCIVGRHCVFAGCSGISGSTVFGDFVVLGGQAATAGHLTVGGYSQYAGRSGIMRDMPSGGQYGGLPAKPVKEWLRELAAVSLLGKGSHKSPRKRKGNP